VVGKEKTLVTLFLVERDLKVIAMSDLAARARPPGPDRAKGPPAPVGLNVYDCSVRQAKVLLGGTSKPGSGRGLSLISCDARSKAGLRRLCPH
jgi:hypothetical protein